MAAWESQNIYLSLAGFVVAKFFLTAVSLGLPIPCGLYTPVFMMGAVGGRLVGELVALCFPDGYITPGGYAVVGAAAMSAGVTRTLSTAVIVFELTGQLEYLIPVLVRR
jgi:chloride channel 2